MSDESDDQGERPPAKTEDPHEHASLNLAPRFHQVSCPLPVISPSLAEVLDRFLPPPPFIYPSFSHRLARASFTTNMNVDSRTPLLSSLPHPSYNTSASPRPPHHSSPGSSSPGTTIREADQESTHVHQYSDPTHPLLNDEEADTGTGGKKVPISVTGSTQNPPQDPKVGKKFKEIWVLCLGLWVSMSPGVFSADEVFDG